MEEAIKILKTGIEIEKNGLAHYLDFAFECKDETGKNMFIRLGRDEFTHLEILTKQLAGLQCGSVWSCEEIPVSIIEKLTPKLRSIEKVKSEKGADELGALKTALDLEKKSIEFYNDAKKKIKNAEAEKIFDRIIEMEESHYDLLQAEIDNIESTGFWFGIREFSLEGER